MQTEFKIIPADEKHIDGLVECHISAFPGEFLTLLGPVFLKSFYKFYCTHPDAICIVAKDANTEFVAGLVAGGAPYVRSQFMRKYIPLYFPLILFKGLINKKVRVRLFEHLKNFTLSIIIKLKIKNNKSINLPPEDPPGTWSSLLSICTHRDYRGRGAAASLIEAFRTESAQRGYRTMRLSVHNDNIAAIELYKRSGWNILFESPKGIYFKREV
jgi:ribosomal protein S18 acetylase RimI-like enzyme